METVRPLLMQINDQWMEFDAGLRKAAEHTVRMTFKLECGRNSRFSLQQSKEHRKHLQVRNERFPPGATPVRLYVQEVGGGFVLLMKMHRIQHRGHESGILNLYQA